MSIRDVLVGVDFLLLKTLKRLELSSIGKREASSDAQTRLTHIEYIRLAAQTDCA